MNELFLLFSVQHVYDGRPVLDIRHLGITRGEFLAIVGPSGAGKSTLLRLLNFLEKPTRGDVYYKHQSSPSLELTRQIAMVFQRPALFARSVRDNVSYGLRVRGDKSTDRVDDLIARVGLSHLAGQHAHKLSGGEIQRAALAQVLAVQPEVLLLDEPTANLDPHNVSLIESLIREQHEQSGTTIVMVTHNVFQARRLAGRVALMLNGGIVEDAPTADFFTSPRDPRTRAFVTGEMVY